MFESCRAHHKIKGLLRKISNPFFFWWDSGWDFFLTLQFSIAQLIPNIAKNLATPKSFALAMEFWAASSKPHPQKKKSQGDPSAK